MPSAASPQRLLLHTSPSFPVSSCTHCMYFTHFYPKGRHASQSYEKGGSSNTLSPTTHFMPNVELTGAGHCTLGRSDMCAPFPGERTPNDLNAREPNHTKCRGVCTALLHHTAGGGAR
eukprot:1156924-Pelagomonas_calceolata.AAC.4